MKYWMAWCVPGKWGHDKWRHLQTVCWQRSAKKIMFLMTVRQDTDGFQTLETSVTFHSMWVPGGGFQQSVLLSGLGSLSVAALRWRVIFMMHSTLELSSSQTSSFIIEIAVSMRAFVTSPFIQVEETYSFPDSCPGFVCRLAFPQISLIFRAGTIKGVDQLSLYAINPAGYLMQMGFSPKRERI